MQCIHGISRSQNLSSPALVSYGVLACSSVSALTYLWLLGIITDNALGKYATEKALDDSDSDTINALPVTQWHRNVDIPILRAHNEGKFQFTRLCA